MKPVAPDAFGFDHAGNRIARGNFGVACVERGVKAGILGQVGRQFGQGVNGGQIMGVVQRCKRRAITNFNADIWGKAHRSG